MDIPNISRLFTPDDTAPDSKPIFCSVCSCVCCRHTFPQRYCMTIMLVTGLTVLYMQRVGLNLAIVDMVLPVEAAAEEALCKGAGGGSTDSRSLNDEQYDWDEGVQSYILLSFYLGYMAGNAVAGYFTDEYGARWFLFGGVFLSTVTTAIIPPLAYYTHWLWVVVARVLAGLGQSTFFPGATSLIARWIPEQQKSSIAAIVMTSFTVGTVAGNVCTGYIIILTNTWCWVYYIYGIVGFCWCIFFYFFVYSDPYTHPRLTDREKTQLASIRRASHNRLPLWRMFCDLSVWSMIIGQFGNDYGLYIVITNMPKYFTAVLNFSTAMTGTLLMLPPAACFLGSIIFGLIADCSIARGMRKIHIRIIMTILCMPVSCCFMILLTIVQCDLIFANVFLCLAMFTKAGFYAGVGVLGIDVSVNYSGILIGIASTAGGLSGMVAPYIIGAVATENTFEQWRLIQYISLCISIVCLIPYLLFAKDYRKDWDYGDDETNPNPQNVPACKRIWMCYRPT